MNISVCSTLSGKLAVKHPKHGFLVREDGYVFRIIPRTNKKYGWTCGYLGNKNGYPVTSIRVGTKSVPHAIHVMVAECFIPNPENKPTVDHKNRIRNDNRVENLRWASRNEQMLNTCRHYDALQKWGFTPINDRKTYNCVRERKSRMDKTEAGLRKFKLDGHFNWIRYYCGQYPLNTGTFINLSVEDYEWLKNTCNKHLRKSLKREYDKVYRELKGETRLKQKRNYYYANREEILKRQRESRKRRQNDGILANVTQ